MIEDEYIDSWKSLVSLCSFSGGIDFEDLDTPGWIHGGVIQVINGAAEKRIDFCRINKLSKMVRDPQII